MNIKLVHNFKNWQAKALNRNSKDNNAKELKINFWEEKMAGVLGFEPR